MITIDPNDCNRVLIDSYEENNNNDDDCHEDKNDKNNDDNPNDFIA